MSTAVQIRPDWRERMGAWRLPSLEVLLDQPPDAANWPGTWEPLRKEGLAGRERWRWTLHDAQGSSICTLYLKRYARTPLRSQWDRCWRQSPRLSTAAWEYLQAEQLHWTHVPAARAVAYAQRMRGPLEQSSVVLLESAAGDGLDRAWQRLSGLGSGWTDGPGRHEVARRLARFIAAFHGTGLCHRDLYLCHVFADFEDGGARPPRFALIDLARAHRPRWFRTRWVVKDLAQLDASARQVGASRSDRLRFLYAYLNLQSGAPRLRYFARRIARKSSAILRREERKARRAGRSPVPRSAAAAGVPS